MSDAVMELAHDKIILWQDHSHPSGYRPMLRMLVYPDGKCALELHVHGNVTVMPYTKPECGHE